MASCGLEWWEVGGWWWPRWLPLVVGGSLGGCLGLWLVGGGLGWWRRVVASGGAYDLLPTIEYLLIASEHSLLTT